MIISPEMIIISLVLGIFLAVFFLLLGIVIKKFKKFKILLFTIDFFFVIISCILNFLFFLAIDDGYPRFLPAVLEIIGFAAVVYLFSKNNVRTKSLCIKKKEVNDYLNNH